MIEGAKTRLLVTNPGQSWVINKLHAFDDVDHMHPTLSVAAIPLLGLIMIWYQIVTSHCLLYIYYIGITYVIMSRIGWSLLMHQKLN